MSQRWDFLGASRSPSVRVNLSQLVDGIDQISSLSFDTSIPMIQGLLVSVVINSFVELNDINCLRIVICEL